MLPFRVFVATHSRRSLDSFLRLTPISSPLACCSSVSLSPRHAVLLTPPKSSHPSQFLSRQHFTPVSPLVATLMGLPASVANKRLTTGLSPLDATLTKNRGVHPSS